MRHAVPPKPLVFAVFALTPLSIAAGLASLSGAAVAEPQTSSSLRREGTTVHQQARNAVMPQLLRSQRATAGPRTPENETVSTAYGEIRRFDTVRSKDVNQISFGLKHTAVGWRGGPVELRPHRQQGARR